MGLTKQERIGNLFVKSRGKLMISGASKQCSSVLGSGLGFHINVDIVIGIANSLKLRTAVHF